MIAETDKRTRVVGMKWVKLGEGKDPNFDEKYLLGNDTSFEVGYLKGINVGKSGKNYTFQCGDNDIDDFTHYCIIKKP